MISPIYLQPTAPLADRVLLPDDPGRALLLAQALLTEPKMFNHNRGLWGYTGPASDGLPLTVQSTGIGGPSASIVMTELAALGARRFVRVGTCRAIASWLELGQLVVATKAIGEDGASRALGHPTGGADPGLAGALTASGRATAATVVSVDLFYDIAPSRVGRWLEVGVAAVDLETAALYALARSRDLEVAAVLAVSDLEGAGEVRIDPDQLRESELRMGETASAALATAPAGRSPPRSEPASPR